MLHPVQKAFKIRAYLTPDQRRAFAQAEGATRYVRRRVLTEMDGHFKATGTRKSLLEMGREVTQWKQREETAWLKDIPSDVIIQELRDLKQAFENFFRALKGKQPGRKVGYPKLKRKSASGAIRFAFDHRHPGKVAGWTGKKVILPKLGMIKLAQPERLPVEMPKLVTLSRDSGGRFFISFSVKQTIEPLPETGVSVGVDLGLIDLAVLSDGTRIPALKELKKKERYLRRQQRILSRRQGSKPGEKKSRRYLKQLRKVNRMHCRMADARRDYAHKASRAIIEKADVIALEDLNVKGMMKNPRLSKALSDAAFRLLRTCLEYKGHWYGRTVCYADRFAATTKICHECDHRVDEMPLSVRTWTCPGCGTLHDRDITAARNILRFAVTPGRGEGAYPDARGGVHPLREGALAPSPKDSGEARTENRLPPIREGHAAEDHDDPRLS